MNFLKCAAPILRDPELADVPSNWERCGALFLPRVCAHDGVEEIQLYCDLCTRRLAKREEAAA